MGSGGYIGATSDGGTKRVTNNGNIEKHDQNDKVAIFEMKASNEQRELEFENNGEITVSAPRSTLV